MKTIFYSRRIPVRYNVDVFVVGAGPSGTSAAITAARQKMRVYIAEAQPAVGRD